MLQPRNRNRTEIQYILITEPTETLIPFVPPMEFNEPVIGFVRQLPIDILQTGRALQYFESRLKKGWNNPYRFQVIYRKNLQFLLDHYPKDQLILFLIDCKAEHLETVAAQLSTFHNLLHYYALFSKLKTTSLPSDYQVDSPGKYLQSLMINQKDIFSALGLPEVELLPEVNIYELGFYTPPAFIPAISNFHISNAINGNFRYGPSLKAFDEDQVTELHKEHAEKALQNPTSFERLDITVDRSQLVDRFAAICHHEKLVVPFHQIDPYHAPLILVAPFQNPDIRPKSKKGEKDDFGTAFSKAMNFEQSQNYINKGLPPVNGLTQMISRLTVLKLQYLDHVAALHSSFNFSPIIRLPTQGKSIYLPLSFFRVEAMGIYSHPTKRKKLNKIIKGFGKQLHDRVISEKLSEELQHKNRQIVAISDLPVEWLDLDGIPLGFSHDICRLPETHLHGLMANFASNEQLEYTIPKDLVQKTLVIFGSEENAFKKWQAPVTELAGKIGFHTRVCLTIKDLVAAVSEVKPDLLIFDCHGGVNQATNTSFLVLGKEILTVDLVVKYNIHAPLVFLSACNTAPTYGTLNTIANAFFETGSLSVTCTYLPININTGSILYTRLLNNLHSAAQQALHPNWLAFLSHLIRTSVISDTFQVYSSSKGKTEAELKTLADQQGTLYTRLMFFSERRKVFSEMDAIIKGLSGKDQHTFASIVPEFLFYSNLGRSDLIRFESHQEAFLKKNPFPVPQEKSAR